ncbi:MAG: helix-turn-helix transcriptional regulator [Candidatus Omnitrophica bacterium]|nr:helix-turn-helix transcriptional regulator [Candidatus Omnitrophota bacterium]
MKSIHDVAYKLLIQKLKQTRLAANLTQTALAKKLNVDQTYVSKYENRERRLDVVELRDVCKALKLNFAGFISDYEKDLKNLNKK